MRRLLVLAMTLAISHTLFAICSSSAKETDADVPLSGISASLQSDLFTGTLTGSIPIDVPPGRNGLQPNLALTYASSGGNGWVGMGWKLEMGTIERQTRWGVLYSPTTTEEQAGKVYTIRVNGMSSDLVQDSVDPNLYRAKIEGGFFRIKKLTTGGWEITDKKGTKYFFGRTTSFQIQDPTVGIFKWCLERVEDRDGNYMAMTYAGDQGQGYLSQIDYTGNGATAPTNQVKFYLENRLDALDMYTSNFKITTAKRLKMIEVKANGTLVRAYKFSFVQSPNTSISVIASMQQFGKDVTLDSSGSITNESTASKLPVMTISSQTPINTFATATEWGANNNWAGPGWFGFGDFNGDGKQDFWYVPSGTSQVLVRLSTGSVFATATEWANGNNWAGPGWFGFGDFNGDGKQDFWYVPSGTSQVLVRSANGPIPDLLASLSNGLGGTTTVTYTPSPQHSTTSTPAHPQLPYPVQTVTSLATTDGNGNSSTTTYSYTGGYHQIGEREFRGFKTAIVTSPGVSDADKTVTTTWFHQGNELTPIDTENPGLANGYMKGTPYRVEVRRKSDSLLYSKLETTYLPDQIGLDTSAPWFTPPAIVTTSIYDSAGVLAKQTQTELVSYDAYGNLTLAYNRGDFTNNNAFTSDDSTTAVTFGNYDTTNWLLAFPTVTTTYAGLGTGGTKLSETKLYYDGASSCTTPAGNLAPTKGHVTKVERWLNGGTNPISGMEYNSYGSVTCIRDPKGNTTNLAYDPTSTFPLTSTNALGYVTTTSYYGVNGVAMDTGLYGQAKSVTDPNSKTSTSTYDALGRKLTTTTPDGLVSTMAYNYGGTFIVGTQNIQSTTSGGGLTTNLVSKTYFDGLGRTTKQESPGAADGGGALKVLATETQYDSRGLVKQSSLPYIQGSESATGRWRVPTYDALGRTIQITNPDTTTSKVCYNGWITTSIDPKLHKKVETKDAYGRVSTVQEYTSTQATCTTTSGTLYATTTYAYDRLGNLLSVTDTKGNVSTMTYDTLGRKLTMHDPDMSNWSYTYDANGNLGTQVDAKNQKLCFSYDALNRRTQKNFGSTTVACGTNAVVYTYDDTVTTYNRKGRLKQVTDPAQSVTFQYDSRGRITQSAKTLDGTTYTTTSAYDGLGRLTSVNYPTNPIKTVTYTYDGPQLKSVLEGATTYVTYAGWNALGQPATNTFGNGVVTTNTYANTGNATCTQQTFRLCTLKTQKGANPLYQDLRYDYEANGNVWNIYDATVASNAGDQHFSYDDLDRLTLANGPYGASGANASLTYQYNEIGNLTLNSQLSATAYGYPTSGASSVRPHAVSTAGANTYIYDNNGNMTGGAGRTYTWNPENKPLTIVQGGTTSTFVYDGDGGRVKKIVGTMTTRYLSKLYECDNANCSRFIWAGSTRIATIASNGAVNYWHGDHLGSSSVITDSTGAKVQTLTYYPYGGTRTNTSPSSPAIDVPYKYTGKELDASTGLYYYEARYYDATLARFISADTIVPDVRNPQTFNRYSYTRNNPLRYIDPNGHNFWDDVSDFFEDLNNSIRKFEERIGLIESEPPQCGSCQRDDFPPPAEPPPNPNSAALGGACGTGGCNAATGSTSADVVTSREPVHVTSSAAQGSTTGSVLRAYHGSMSKTSDQQLIELVGAQQKMTPPTQSHQGQMRGFPTIIGSMVGSSNVSSAMSSVLQGILTGTRTFQDGLTNQPAAAIAEPWKSIIHATHEADLSMALTTSVSERLQTLPTEWREKVRQTQDPIGNNGDASGRSSKPAACRTSLEADQSQCGAEPERP